MVNLEYTRSIGKKIRNITWEDVKAGGRVVRNKTVVSVVSTTGILVASSPIQVVADTAINEYIGKGSDLLNLTLFRANELTAMTDDNSIGGKLGMAVLMYGGFGLIYNELRDKSQKYFGLDNPQDKKTENLLRWHDRVLTFLYSSTMLIGGYHLFGEHDGVKIGWAVFVNALTQYHRGFLVGAAVDWYKDFFGLKECSRPSYPKYIKNLGRKAKIGVAALGVAASIGLMAAMYSLTPSEWDNPNRLAERQCARYQSLEEIVK